MHWVHHLTNTWCKKYESAPKSERTHLTYSYGDPVIDENGDPWFPTGETDDDEEPVAQSRLSDDRIKILEDGREDMKQDTKQIKRDIFQERL